jgi:hypothetical protein
MSNDRQTTPMRRLKRIAVLLLAGFLTFAPPGTLIFGAILILGLIGNVWVIVGVIVSLIILTTLLLLRRHSAKKRNL